MTVKPIINGFEFVPNQVRCKCDADLHLSAWLHDQHDGCARIACLACGTVVAHVAADLIDYGDTEPAPRDEKAADEWPFDDDCTSGATDDDPPF